MSSLIKIIILEDPLSYFGHLLLIITSVLNPLSIEAITGMVFIIVLLILSGLVSGSEVAFFSLTPQDLEKLSDQKSKNSQLIIKLLKRPKRLLATILISNNFINVGIIMASSYVSMLLFNLSENLILSFIIQVVVITSVLLIFGEIMPKIIATHKPVKFSMLIAPFIHTLSKIFYKLSSLLVYSTKIIDKKFDAKKQNISMTDISEAIDITGGEKNKDKEKKILKGIVNFSDLIVREIMRSRVDVTAIDYNTSYQEILDTVIKKGYSRIPVYKENFDHVQGLLYVKDLIPHINKKDFQWQKILRKPYYVPENKPISDLLQEFQEDKIHLAIVVDEYGGSSGIVTLEDILEEIVGDINDEFDMVKKANYSQLKDNVYIFEAKTSLTFFCKVFDKESKYFDEVKGESDTLAGLILEKEGGIPPKGAKINILEFEFEILEIDVRRIVKVKVTFNENKNDEENH